jgi:hypothetical protein
MAKIYEMIATDIGELTIKERYSEATMDIIKEQGMAWTCDAVKMHPLSEEDKNSWTYRCLCNREMQFADSKLYKHNDGQWYLLLIGASEVKE